jgi:hypothetical protein
MKYLWMDLLAGDGRIHLKGEDRRRQIPAQGRDDETEFVSPGQSSECPAVIFDRVTASDRPDSLAASTPHPSSRP